MLALGHLVVGMHLYAEVALGVDELHQQGQLAVILIVDSTSENLYRMVVDDRHEVSPTPLAVANDANAGRHGTHLPALADGLVRGFKTFIRT